jgi:REP element-mobilizing transposase RayT
MARISRVVGPGYPHHVTQRGVRSIPIFSTDQGRHAYLDILAEQLDRFRVEVLAWCLMQVDFIIADHAAVEVKAKENISSQDVKSLHALGEEKKLKRYLCVSLERRRRTMDAVTVLPWEEFLDELWSGHYT